MLVFTKFFLVCTIFTMSINVMAAEPLRYFSDDQFLGFKTADYVVAAKVVGLKVSKHHSSTQNEGLFGSVLDVSAKLLVFSLFRGNIDEDIIEWDYQLQFGVAPTLKKGDVGIFFFNKMGQDKGRVLLRATYLLEDSGVVLNGVCVEHLRTSDKSIQLSVSRVDEKGYLSHHFWVSDDEQTNNELGVLQNNLNLQKEGNYLTLFKKGEEGWQVLESVILQQKWPY